MSEVKMQENLWGYAKRLRFVAAAICDAFPDKETLELTVLDVGCGTGSQLGIPLARDGYKLIGIDMHEASIMEAKRNSKDLSNAEFICGDVGLLNNDNFDIVILSEVLEHVSKPEELLESSLKKLSDDGLMIVTVPNGYGEFEWDSWVFRGLGLERLIEKYEQKKAQSKRAVSSTENQDDRHIQFFTQKRLRRMFDRFGLKVVRQSGSTVLSGPFAGHTFARVPGFIDLNSKAADKLPMAFSSGWFFALRRRGDE